MDRRIRELLEEREALRAKATAPAKEVLEHLYKAIMATPSFTLKDGTKATLDPYFSPELDKNGELQCGVDVLLDNGTHLEFMVTNTGWGKAIAPQPKSTDTTKSRGR